LPNVVYPTLAVPDEAQFELPVTLFFRASKKVTALKKGLPNHRARREHGDFNFYYNFSNKIGRNLSFAKHHINFISAFSMLSVVNRFFQQSQESANLTNRKMNLPFFMDRMSCLAVLATSTADTLL
jgi:hypothetical protein